MCKGNMTVAVVQPWQRSLQTDLLISAGASVVTKNTVQLIPKLGVVGLCFILVKLILMANAITSGSCYLYLIVIFLESNLKGHSSNLLFPFHKLGDISHWDRDIRKCEMVETDATI